MIYPEPGDGLIRINVITPKVATRSTTEPMPSGSTIRLFVYKHITWNTSMPELVAEETYRIDENGATVLCNVDPNTGQPTGDITDRGLHLPADTYNFYSISPAIKLTGGTGNLPRMMINHGSNLSLRTSILENKKIEYFSNEVPNGKPGIFNLMLNTHTLLTSKITFKLKKGDKIGEMMFEDTERVAGDTKLRSIAIDGLPPINYGNYNFVIGNERLIQVQAATGNGVVGISKADIIEVTDPALDYQYYFETELLPCRLLDKNGIPIPGATEDDLSTIEDSKLEEKATELRLHLWVAENEPGAEKNYKMFTVKLPAESFLRGQRYNYTLLVNLGGILVSGWNTDSNWETTIN